MKRNWLTRLLAAALGALFMVAWAGPVTAFYNGPEESGYYRDTGQGDMDKERTGECCPTDEIFQLLGVDEQYPEWPHEGPVVGGDNKTGHGDLDRTRNPETHE